MGRFRFSNARRNAAALREEEEEKPAPRGWSSRRFLSSFGELWLLRPLRHRRAPATLFAVRLGCAAQDGAAPRGFGSVRFRTATPAGPGKRRSGEGEPQRALWESIAVSGALGRNFPVSSGAAEGGSDSGRALRRLQPGAAPGAAGRGRGPTVRSGLGAGGGSWGIRGTSASCGGDKRNGRRSAAPPCATDSLRRSSRPRARPPTAPGGGSQRAEAALGALPGAELPPLPLLPQPPGTVRTAARWIGAAAPSGRGGSAAAPRPSAGPSRRRCPVGAAGVQGRGR